MATGLKAVRTARGWSQDRLIYEMRRFAEQRLLDIASAASLKTYISEWENGRRTITDRYAAILRPLLGVTDGELRGTADAREPQTDGYADLLSRIDAAGSLSESMVPSFLAQTELLRTMDRQMGATGLVDQMNGHLAAMEEALTFAVLPGMRKPIATALAGASTLAAWQALDSRRCGQGLAEVRARQEGRAGCRVPALPRARHGGASVRARGRWPTSARDRAGARRAARPA